jgi:hypothetical protein
VVLEIGPCEPWNQRFVNVKDPIAIGLDRQDNRFLDDPGVG